MIDYNPFKLNPAIYDSNLECASCKTRLSVSDWDTEYGEPLDGDYDCNCPVCNHKFKLQIETTTTFKITA